MLDIMLYIFTLFGVIGLVMIIRNIIRINKKKKNKCIHEYEMIDKYFTESVCDGIIYYIAYNVYICSKCNHKMKENIYEKHFWTTSRNNEVYDYLKDNGYKTELEYKIK